MTEIHGRKPTVLLVDDEPMVTQALALFLELESDYEVVTCGSGAEALEVAGGRPGGCGGIRFPDARHERAGAVGRSCPAGSGNPPPDADRLCRQGRTPSGPSTRWACSSTWKSPWRTKQFLLALKNALAHKGVRAALHDKIQELDRTLRQRDELSDREEEMRREMEWAATVQARFLPRKIPAADPYSLAVVYRPAMAVGGDFYEFVPLAGRPSGGHRGRQRRTWRAGRPRYGPAQVRHLRVGRAGSGARVIS